jgi:hypothetical protein
MRKTKDTLFFIIGGKIWGSHLVGHPEERKGWSGEPFCLEIQIKEKFLLFLMRDIVFLENKSNQGEHGGSRN